MKMKHSIFAGFAALVLWACQASLVEPVPETPEQPEVPEVPEVPSFKVLTIEAGVPGQTKTSYAGEWEFSWSPSDQVSVLCNDGSVNKWITFTGQTAAFTSKFTSPQVPATYEMGTTTGGKKIALYPASDDHVYSDTDVSYYLPAERDFRVSHGGHEESAIPMFAYGDDNDAYHFANLTGAVKFTFTGVLVPEVKFVFTSAGNKQLNGDIPLTGLGSSASGVTWDPATTTDVTQKTLTLYADVPSSQSVSFYVPYVGTLPAGCHVQLQEADGTFVLFDKSTTKEIEVVKNHITVVDDLDVSPSGTPYSINLVHLDQDVRNPERGFTHPNVLEYNGTTFPSVLNNVGDGNSSLVFISFNLSGYKSIDDDLPSAVLTAIGDAFDQVRNLGKKAVIRFYYTTDENDAPRVIVTKHIGNLAPVFDAHKDVIYVVQAGFIGASGEWHSSINFSKSGLPGNYGAEVTDTFFENHSAVVDALLVAVPQSRQIALRTPNYKRYYARYNKSVTGITSCWEWKPLTSFDGIDYNSRLAFHNDGFAGNVSDVGTFQDWKAPWGDASLEENVDRRMWYSQSAYLACGGETSSVRVDPSYSEFDKAKESIYNQHLSYLNNLIGDSGCLGHLDDNQKKRLRMSLGYHLWLKEAKVYYDALSAGEEITVSCQLKNEGAAPVIYPRPMKLVLLRGDNVTELADNMGDVRKVASNGGIRSFFAKFTIPAGGIQSGDKLALWLPDASASIAGRAVYAIHLANDHDSDDTEWVTISNSTDPANPAQATGGYNVFYTFP